MKKSFYRSGDYALKGILKHTKIFMADFLTQKRVFYESKNGQSASTYSTKNISSYLNYFKLGHDSRKSRSS